MTLKQRVYKILPFIPKINLAIGVKIHNATVKLNEETTKKRLSTHSNIYANIGCGSAGLAEDWINVDYSKYENVNCIFDCRKKLPFANQTVKGLYTEHFFEHLDYINEVPEFLANCYRVLQNGGVLRIVVPDAGRYLEGYCSEGWDLLKKIRPLDDQLVDSLMGIRYETKIQLINEVFRQGGEHKYAWDFDTMALMLRKEGFQNIQKMSYRKSNDELMAIDQPERRPESLYVEAIK